MGQKEWAWERLGLINSPEFLASPQSAFRQIRVTTNKLLSIKKNIAPCGSNFRVNILRLHRRGLSTLICKKLQRTQHAKWQKIFSEGQVSTSGNSNFCLFPLATKQKELSTKQKWVKKVTVPKRIHKVWSNLFYFEKYFVFNITSMKMISILTTCFKKVFSFRLPFNPT